MFTRQVVVSLHQRDESPEGVQVPQLLRLMQGCKSIFTDLQDCTRILRRLMAWDGMDGELRTVIQTVPYNNTPLIC